MAAFWVAVKIATYIVAGTLFVISSGAAFPSMGKRFRMLSFAAATIATVSGIFFVDDLVAWFTKAANATAEIVEPGRDPALCGELIQMRMNAAKQSMLQTYGASLTKAAKTGNSRDLCFDLNYTLTIQKEVVYMLYKCPATLEYRALPNDQIRYSRAEAIRSYEFDLEFTRKTSPWTAYHCDNVLSEMGVTPIPLYPS